MFSIVDRYVATRFLFYFFAGLLVFVTLFVAVDAISMMARYQASGVVLARYYMYLLPSVINQLLPIACLLGTMFTITMLNRSNELVALFSCGMSLARISAPILVLVVLISGIVFVASDRLLPVFAKKANYILYVDVRKQPGLYSTVKTDKIWYRSRNVLFNIKTLLENGRGAQGLTMYYFNNDWTLEQMLTAESVDFNNANWILHEGSITLFVQESSFPLTQDFKVKTISAIEDIKDLQNADPSSDVLTLAELHHFIKKNKEAGLDTLRYEVDYHHKFGFAFTAFVLSFLGIPFSVTRQRSGGVVKSVAACMALAFLYWGFFNSAIALGRHGTLPPLIAAWVPNLAMLLLSFFFLARLKK